MNNKTNQKMKYTNNMDNFMQTGPKSSYAIIKYNPFYILHTHFIPFYSIREQHTNCAFIEFSS